MKLFSFEGRGKLNFLAWFMGSIRQQTSVLLYLFNCKPWLNNCQVLNKKVLLGEIPMFKKTWMNNLAFTEQNAD